MTTHGQRNHGRGTSVPILPPRAACGPPDRTDILLSVTPLARSGSVASCPLVVTAMPLATFAVAGHGTGLLLSRCAAVPRECLFPYDPLLFPYADAYTHWQQGGPHDRPRSRDPPRSWEYPADPSRSRDPLCGPARCAYRDHQPWPMYIGQNVAYTSPWGPSMGPSSTWHQPAQPSPATAGPPLGDTSLGLYGDSLAQRQPQVPASSLGAHQRLRPADLYRLALHGHPPRFVTPRPPTRRGPGLPSRTGSHGADQEASATVARLLTSLARNARPATPRTGRLHRRLQSLKRRNHAHSPPP